MGYQKVFPLGALLLLCAGVGVHAQLPDIFGVLPEECRAPARGLVLGCLPEITEGLEVLGVNGLAEFDKIVDIDFSDEAVKKKFDDFLASFSDDDDEGKKKKNKKDKKEAKKRTIRPACCKALEGLEEEKCGCKPAINDLAEASGQPELISGLVSTFVTTCKAEVSFTIDGECQLL